MPRFLLRSLSLLIVLLTVACDDREEIDEDAADDDMLPLTDVEPTPGVDLTIVLTNRPRPTHDAAGEDPGVDDLPDDEADDDEAPADAAG